MPEIPIFLMSKAVSDSAPTEGTLQNGSCNDHDSVIARELKIIAPSSQPSTPSKLWFDIQASRDLDCNRDDQADITETTSGMNRKKLSSITGCNPLKTPIKRSLDMDGQPDSSHPGSPVFENYSSLQFPDCDIIDDDKDHGKISAWGAKIGSVLGIPMRRIGSRKKSLDYRKPVQSGLDALERERNPPKAQPDLYSDGHDISVGGVKSQLPPHTSIEETLHDRQPSPTGETHHPVFQNTRDHAFGSSVRSPHQLAPAQSQSRMRQGFSKYSDKIATWRASPRTDGDHQSQPFASEKLSFSNPPKRFKSRVNRFLRPGQGNDAEDIIPPSVLHDEGSDISAGAFHVAILGAFTNSEQPPPTKLGFRSNLTKRVNSARKRMSLPFIFSPEVTPSDLPGHSFLPSEAKCVTVATTPPYLEHNHITQEWTLQDFRDMNMIRPSPPLSSPGSEDSPPQSPWSEVNNMTRSPTPPRALPIAPKINAVAPFESQERIPEIEAKESITKTSAVSPVITINHEHPHPEDPRDRPKSSTGTNELDATATLQGISALPGGKPIELLEEEERRNRRDSRVMGLNPETMPGDDMLPGQVHEDGRRDTYGAAIREIAGLELTLRGPPVLPSNRLGDVSGPNSNINNFSSPALQLTSNDELAAAFPATPPSDSPESETTTVTKTQPYDPLPRSGVIPAPNTLTKQFTITPALTTIPIPASSQSQQHLLMPRRISSSFIVEELSSRVCVKVAPQQMVTPVTASLSTRTDSYLETPLLGNSVSCNGASPVRVRINGNGNANVSPYHLDEAEEEEGGGEEDERGRGQGKGDINAHDVPRTENAG